MKEYGILITAILMTSCTAIHTKKKLPTQEYRVHKVDLRPHQIAPLIYMQEHPDQKGLVLAHYLGTGKTFTALAFAEQYPNHKVIVLSPSFIKANWLLHMNKMGIKDQQRYELFSFEDAAINLPKKDITSTVVIVDEVHRLIEGVRSSDADKRRDFGNLYSYLKKAHRILLLSGTPIFNEISDTAFVFNLAAGKDVLPYNEREFLDKFTKIRKGSSFWRGHTVESNILIFGLPFVLAGIPLAFISPTITLIGGLYFSGLALGFTILPIAQAALPLESTPMRYFDAEKLKNLSRTYVSYFDFRFEKDPHYPKKKIHEKAVSYNNAQERFFMNFTDMSLSKEDLALIAREKSYGFDTKNLNLDSTTLQKKLKNWPDSGREIGNLSFYNDEQKLIEAPKFVEVLKLINKALDGVVVYSSYYENGTKLFAEFLDRHGKSNSYKVLHPALSINEQIAMINDYNAKKFPILLLHPLFTEGISLEGTRQLHILEPIPSQALFEQIIGRTIRYNSHEQLPASERLVNVYAWKASFDGFSAIYSRNENWGKRFTELNSLASFGSGLTHKDPNYERKQLSFDEYTDFKRISLSDAINALNQLFDEYSIERSE